MNNIISSDFYRVRRGAALRNTCLGLLLVVVFIMIMLIVMQSDKVPDMLATTNNLTPAEEAELRQSMQESITVVENGAEFGLEVLAESIIFMFFLPIAIAVFCADFTAGTYRNTLSYESNRTKVYMAKLLLSIGLCLAMVIGTVIVSLILGAFAFGFSGITTAAVGKLLIVILLQLPIYLATITVCHCLASITKKSSMTIAFFLVGYFVLTLIVQLMVGAFSLPEWLMVIEPQSAGKFAASFETAPVKDIAILIAYYMGVSVIALLLGAGYYKKTDMP